MVQNSSRTAGRHFLQIPGPTPVPDRILRAMDMPVIDHRGPEFGKLGKRVLDGIKTIFKCAGPVIIYPASGTGAWEAALCQHDVARRQGADVRDRPLRLAVEVDGGEARASAGIHRVGLARRRRPRKDRGAAQGRQGARDQGGVRGAQRDLDRLRDADQRGAPRDRCGRASGAADGRHHLVARLDRLPARRVGRGRHRRRLAEGPDAAAGPLVQRARREGAERQPRTRSCRSPTGAGRR